MTHPGIAFAFVIGVGIATMMYYMFADTHQQHHNNNNNNGYGGVPPDMSDNSWTNNNNDSYRKTKNNRRKKSNCSTTEKTSCTICLTEISIKEMVNVLPCSHGFHRICIDDWQQRGPAECHNRCPNCRKKIESVQHFEI